MNWLDSVNFDEKGLIPAIAQDKATGRILMMAWQNREALQLTADTKQAVYFSRSRNKLWHKGESSGHFQQVHEIRLDCDADVIVLVVTQIGGIACHTGRASCFYRLLTDDNGKNRWQVVDEVLKDPSEIYQIVDALSVSDDEKNTNVHTFTQNIDNSSQDILTKLDKVLNERKTADAKSSYVASLYDKGLNKILEKVGEEATEAIIASKDLQIEANADNRSDVIYEIADVWFHTMVTLAWFNIPVTAITDELARRFGLSGIDEKNARTQS